MLIHINNCFENEDFASNTYYQPLFSGGSGIEIIILGFSEFPCFFRLEDFCSRFMGSSSWFEGLYSKLERLFSRFWDFCPCLMFCFPGLLVWFSRDEVNGACLLAVWACFLGLLCFSLVPGFILQGSNLQGTGQRGLSSRFCGIFSRFRISRVQVKGVCLLGFVAFFQVPNLQGWG